MNDYIFDVFIDVPPNRKVWLIDINPWIPIAVDSILYDWKELENWTKNEIDFKIV